MQLVFVYINDNFLNLKKEKLHLILCNDAQILRCRNVHVLTSVFSVIQTTWPFLSGCAHWWSDKVRVCRTWSRSDSIFLVSHPSTQTRERSSSAASQMSASPASSTRWLLHWFRWIIEYALVISIICVSVSQCFKTLNYGS